VEAWAVDSRVVTRAEDPGTRPADKGFRAERRGNEPREASEAAAADAEVPSTVGRLSGPVAGTPISWVIL